MKRPTKPFVVEYKRSARKAFGPSMVPAMVIAARLPTPAADSIPKSPLAAASALFENSSEASPSSQSEPAEPRILPVVIIEIDTSMEATPAEDPLQANAGPSPKTQANVSPRKAKTRRKSSTSEASHINAHQPTVEAENDRGGAGTSEPRAASDPVVRRRRRLLEGEDRLPRGERWKRRLPKFMR